MYNAMYLENNYPLPNLSAIELWYDKLPNTRVWSTTAFYSVVIRQDAWRGPFDSDSLFF